MFTVNKDERQLRFWFTHHTVREIKSGKSLKRYITSCNVTDVTDDPKGGPRIETLPLLYTADAITNPKDQFVKETGRKVALNKVLAGMSKGARTLVWNAYWRAKKQEQRVND